MDKIDSIDSAEVAPANEQDKRCAPGVTFESGSCIRLKVLIAMANAYNQQHPETQISLFPQYEILNPPKYKKYILREMNKKMNGSQRSWASQLFVKQMDTLYKEELEKHTFRPSGPKGKFEWLNTLHIDDVMSQYEHRYPQFKFLGTVPMDFDDFERFGIRNLNYNDLVNSGKTQLGIVFNLDNHNESGSHWVAMYANLKDAKIYYFDSYGIEPELRVRKLMRRIARFCQTGLGIPDKQIVVDYNKQRHQKENSECGVYSINFILRLLRGDSFEHICASQIPDRKINKCRNVYFNNTKV